ncbi:pirin family protein [Streptomyces sp. NBC_01352]|uniref:pirin family protein n=1 Tax=Streptomyces sp. NBC_01352 TaxID=2903834 RepID=UPI002E30021D|nr:pirin family protein [Streptomyces sp. NBC_01352]
MPAISVPDLLVLPRVPDLSEITVDRPVAHLKTGVDEEPTEGFGVRRVFPTPGAGMRMSDPFLLLDHRADTVLEPRTAKGRPWHPHRGFETVTYLIDGEIEHEDTHGGGGIIRGGDTQWMTAGSGVQHHESPSERLVMEGGVVQGVQLWVNLPSELKMAPPRYQDIDGSRLALLTSQDGGALMRVIAGEIAGHRGPGVTHTPITLAHASIAPGARLRVPWRPDFSAMVYVLSGQGSVGAERRPVAEGEIAYFGAGESLTVTAGARQPDRTGEMEVLLLGGLPLSEPLAAYGPFVMNTHEEIVQAVADYRSGRMGVIPAKAV